MVFARRVLGDSLGSDSALPKHKTTTIVKPDGSHLCAVKIALHIICARNSNQLLESVFFLGGRAT